MNCVSLIITPNIYLSYRNLLIDPVNCPQVGSLTRPGQPGSMGQLGAAGVTVNSKVKIDELFMLVELL